jgi:hypothetical protein
VTRLPALGGLVLTACGAGGGAERPKPPPPAPVQSAEAFSREEARWPKFHSVRFRITVPLPDGKAWRIDDHSQPELHAVHDPTRSRLVFYMWNEHELMNRARCEERARTRGLVPGDPQRPLETVEDTVTVGPEAFDTRVWVAIRPGTNAETPVSGHVFAFGSYVRRCLFVHFESEVPSAKQEEVLSSRLALVKVRLVGAIALDPERTTDIAEVPVEKR